LNSWQPHPVTQCHIPESPILYKIEIMKTSNNMTTKVTKVNGIKINLKNTLN